MNVFGTLITVAAIVVFTIAIKDIVKSLREIRVLQRKLEMRVARDARRRYGRDRGGVRAIIDFAEYLDDDEVKGNHEGTRSV